MANKKISSLRKEYLNDTLEISKISKSPFEQFDNWLKIALESTSEIEATAMALATVNKNLLPSVRMVLLKEFDQDGFIWYSHYESKKANDLVSNNKASLLFFWQSLERQVRIEGTVTKIARDKTSKYFYQRPVKSQVAAACSPQSQILDSKQALLTEFEQKCKEYQNKPVPLPENWGGYQLSPNYFEFWQGRANRLHDRIAFSKANDTWAISRLAP